MTREEAKKEFWKEGGVFENLFKYCFDKVLKLPYKGSVVDVFIDKIYDNFESKICKNCKYYNSAYKVCENKRNIQPFEIDTEYVNMFTDDDFGCNRFERKEK